MKRRFLNVLIVTELVLWHAPLAKAVGFNLDISIAGMSLYCFWRIIKNHETRKDLNLMSGFSSFCVTGSLKMMIEAPRESLAMILGVDSWEITFCILYQNLAKCFSLTIDCLLNFGCVSCHAWVSFHALVIMHFPRVSLSKKHANAIDTVGELNMRYANDIHIYIHIYEHGIQNKVKIVNIQFKFTMNH